MPGLSNSVLWSKCQLVDKLNHSLSNPHASSTSDSIIRGWGKGVNKSRLQIMMDNRLGIAGVWSSRPKDASHTGRFRLDVERSPTGVAFSLPHGWLRPACWPPPSPAWPVTSRPVNAHTSKRQRSRPIVSQVPGGKQADRGAEEALCGVATMEGEKRTKQYS